MTNPFQYVKDFERAVAEYTGAPYAVAVNSCTAALTLAVAWNLRNEIMAGRGRGDWSSLPQIEIPKYTYVGVPYAIIEAGGRPVFREEAWKGFYQLSPLPVWDSARFFSSGMYIGGRDVGVVEKGPLPSGARYEIEIHETSNFSGHMICVSFHASKTLGDTQGGAILLDDYVAAEWLKRARFDGRSEGVPPAFDKFPLRRAWHCYLSPDVATRLLWHLRSLPMNNVPLPHGPGTDSDYPDLSQLEAFHG